MGMARNAATKEDGQVAKKKDGAKKGKQNAKEEAVVDFAAIDHPYVVVLNKKLRSFKKKQEKIKALEDSLRGQSKQLNEQQLEVLSNKGFVDKMIVELEALRQQFAETVLVPATTSASEANTVEDATAAAPSEEGDVSSLNHLNEDVSDGKDPVDDLDDEDKAASVNSATSGLNVVTSSVDVDEEKLGFVHSILKLLHAVSLHQALGHDVPMALDYFVKVLVGVTRPPAEVSFPENLAESLEEAKRYVLKSDKILACDMSYRQLSEAVDQLVAPRPPVQHEVAEAAPQINFFTESELDKDTTTVTSDESTQVRGEDETFVVVDVVDKPATAPHTGNSRPHSGNRRNKNSPREGAGDNDKERKPRKVYQPRNKGPAGDHPIEQNGGNSRTPAPQRSAAPKSTGNDGDKRPATSNSSRRSNNKQGGDRPRPKKVEQDVSP